MSPTSSLVRLGRAWSRASSPISYLARRFIRSLKDDLSDDQTCGARVCVDLGAGNAPYRGDLEQALPVDLYIALDIAPTDATTLVADASRLPLADNSARYVVSFDVIQHIPDSMAVLAEAARVLRPGGLMVLAFPFNYCECDVLDFRRWTLAGMHRELDLVGLQVLRLEQRGGRFFAFACALNWAVQHMVPGQRRGWHHRRSAGAYLRAALLQLVTLPTMLLQWLMLGVDALFPNCGSYMGGILVATKPRHDTLAPLPTPR